MESKEGKARAALVGAQRVVKAEIGSEKERIAEQIENELLAICNKCVERKQMYIMHGVLWRTLMRCYIATTEMPTGEEFIELAKEMWKLNGEPIRDYILTQEKERREHVN